MSRADVLPLVADREVGTSDARTIQHRVATGMTTMANFKIEREVMIDAPVEVVWRTVTEPDQISQWFADRVELEAEPGGRGIMVFGDQASPVVVEAVDPPTRFSFRWTHPAGEEPGAGNSMPVQATLGPDGGERPRLAVAEVGHERVAC